MAVMGWLEPLRNSATAYEVGVLITITAPSQELADQIAALVSHVSPDDPYEMFRTEMVQM
jgi:hypothetical protein